MSSLVMRSHMPDRHTATSKWNGSSALQRERLLWDQMKELSIFGSVTNDGKRPLWDSHRGRFLPYDKALNL